MVQMKDIAREADVSVQTVSRALTGKGYVSDGVRHRVQGIADRLGYRPNRAAQRLRGRVSDEIVVICFPMDERSIARLAPFEAAVRKAGYRCTFMLEQAANRRLQSITDDLLRTSPAAVLTDRVMTAAHRKVVKRLDDAGIECLVMDSRRTTEFGVAIDRNAGVGDAMAYLIGKGHTGIAYVGLPADPSRRDAYDRAVAEHGLTSMVLPIDRDGDRFEQGRAALADLLALKPRPTAVQAFNDEVALGLIAAAAEQGVHVPDDLAIVGFDNLRAAAWCVPPLTTVAHPHQEAGELAARMLLARLNPKANPADADLPRRPVLPMRLVVRQSA